MGRKACFSSQPSARRCCFGSLFADPRVTIFVTLDASGLRHVLAGDQGPGLVTRVESAKLAHHCAHHSGFEVGVVDLHALRQLWQLAAQSRRVQVAALGGQRVFVTR